MLDDLFFLLNKIFKLIISLIRGKTKQNENRLIDTENKLVVEREKGSAEGR